MLSQAESICFRKLRNLCWPICLVSRPKAFQFLPRRPRSASIGRFSTRAQFGWSAFSRSPCSEPTTARAGNLTGTLTQPVFNELARFDPEPPLRHLRSFAVAAPFFIGNQTNCLSGARLNFHVRPRLTFGMPPRRPSSAIYQIFVCCRL